MKTPPLRSLPSAEDKRHLLAQLLCKPAGTPPAARPSAEQLRWHARYRSSPGNPASHVVFTARIHRSVDTAALQHALQALLDRHEPLRARFPLRDGELVRDIAPPHPAAFETVDAAGWSDVDLHAAAQHVCRQPFDLATGPLFRAHLFTRRACEHLFVIVIHRIVFHGWSLWLNQDAVVLLRHSRPAPTPGSHRSYLDFLHWHQVRRLAPAVGQTPGNQDDPLRELLGASLKWMDSLSPRVGVAQSPPFANADRFALTRHVPSGCGSAASAAPAQSGKPTLGWGRRIGDYVGDAGPRPWPAKAERRRRSDASEAAESENVLASLLHEGIERQVANMPDAIAVSFAEHRLSYRELNHRVNQLANYLRALGVVPDTVVAVCMERSLEMAVALLGIIKAGGAYLPLDPKLSPERLRWMLEDARASFILSHSVCVDVLPKTHTRRLLLDTHWHRVEEMSPVNPKNRVKPYHLACVRYPSHSAAQPKSDVCTHRGIANRLQWMQDAFRLAADDSVLQMTPFTLDESVWEFFWPLMAGARLVMAMPDAERDGASLADLICRESITTLHLEPPLLHRFLHEPRAPQCTALRRVFWSGGTVPPDLGLRFQEVLQAELHALCGRSETATGLDAAVGSAAPLH